MEAIYSFSEAARLLGIDRYNVATWVSLLGMEPGQHPSNGRAKALTGNQIATLREAIEAGRRVVAQSA